jgi:putative oxidoreductase
MSTMSSGSSATGEPRPLIPALAKFYPLAADLSWVLIRVTTGLLLIPHSWPKVGMGPAAVGARVATPNGFEPAILFGALIIFLETIGGLMIAVGLFTRVVAALLFIEFLVIIKVHAPRGWFMSTNGAELGFLWAILFLAIMLRGGGPYSLDRKLGREI